MACYVITDEVDELFDILCIIIGSNSPLKYKYGIYLSGLITIYLYLSVAAE